MATHVRRKTPNGDWDYEFINAVTALANNHNINERQAAVTLDVCRDTIRRCCKDLGIIWKRRHRKTRIGVKIGLITILDRTTDRKDKQVVWKCICDCGEVCFLNSDQLYKQSTASCGCLIKARSYISIFRDVYGGYKNSAKSRQLDFQITFEEAFKLMKENCHYCGVEPRFSRRKPKSNGKRPRDQFRSGMDRVDNNKGYILENLVPCCITCNLAKMEMSVHDFKIWITKIYNHFCT